MVSSPLLGTKYSLIYRFVLLLLATLLPTLSLLAEEYSPVEGVFVSIDSRYPRSNIDQCFQHIDDSVSSITLNQDAIRSCLDSLAVFENIVIGDDQNGLHVNLFLKNRINQISISGIDRKSSSKLARQIDLREGDWFSLEQLEKSRRQLLPLMKQFGYYNATIKVSHEKIDSYPLVAVRFEVDGGYQSKIVELRYSSQPPSELRPLLEEIEDNVRGLPASKELVAELVRLIRTKVRSEGYLQALVERLSLDYEPLGGDVVLSLKTRWKEPLSFFFSGNNYFSNDELLEPLRLETRSIPFSANAVQSFVRAVERKYKNSGFLGAEVSYVEREPLDGRRLFDIKIKEAEQFFVSQIDFDGNLGVSDKKLLTIVSARTRTFVPVFIWQRGFVSWGTLRNDVIALEDYYRENGYRDVEVSSDLQCEDDSTSCVVTFKIIEGEQYLIRRVRLRWLDMYKLFQSGSSQAFEVLRYKTKLAVDQAFSANSIKKEQQRIAAFLLQAGFPNATVRSDYRVQSGVLNFVVSPGPYVKVGKVTFQGNLLTNNSALSREMEIDSGQVWDTEQLLRSQQNLYNTGIFRSVRLKPSDGKIDQPSEDLFVDVVERDTGSLSGGITFDTVDGVHVNGELAQRNFNGTGNRLSLTLDGYLKSEVEAGYARLQYVQRRIFNSDASLINELFGQFAVQYIDQFSYDRAGYRATIRKPIAEDLVFSSSLGLFNENIFDVDQRVVIDPFDESSHEVADLGLSLDFDKRDSPNIPTQGYRSQLRLGMVHDIADSELSLLDLKAQHSFFFRPLDRLVWANNIRYQIVESVSSEQVVPLSRRLFLGGRESLRGYGRFSVSPRHADGIAVGGDRSIDGTTELRLETVSNLVLIGFFDFGVSYLENSGSFSGDSLDAGDFRYSPGVGLAYQTPVGPLSIEYGFALDRDPVDEYGRFAVSIGSRF